MKRNSSGKKKVRKPVEMLHGRSHCLGPPALSDGEAPRARNKHVSCSGKRPIATTGSDCDGSRWQNLKCEPAFMFLIYLRPSRLPKCWDTVRNMKWEYWYMDGTKGAYYPPQCQVEAWESFPVPGKTLPWPCGCAPYKNGAMHCLGLFRHSWSPKPGSGLDRSRQPHLKKENGKVPPTYPKGSLGYARTSARRYARTSARRYAR